MYDGKPKFDNQIIPKKSQNNNQDLDGKKGRKKGKNNLQKEKKAAVEIEQEQIERKQPRGKVVNTKDNSQQSDEKILIDLCLRHQQYLQGTILKVLQQTGFNKQAANNILLQMEPDAKRQKYKEEEEDLYQQFQIIKQSKNHQIQETSTSSAPSQVANALMNQVFDNLLKEEINGREFEELFEEIREMIKQDQQEKGVGMLEINSLVDECQDITQTLLVGFREELSNFDDFQFDQASPLYAQTQQFVQDLIRKQIKQQKLLQEDFPILESDCGKKSIIDAIRQQNRIKKEQEHYFTPSRNTLPKFARQTSNEMSIFNVDNKLKSQKDLVSLHKQFYDVPIIDIKFIYKAFLGDINICRQFLMKHYESKRNLKVVREVRTVSKSNQSSSVYKMSHSHMREEQIDEQLKHLTLDEIRQELDHLYKLRQAFKLTKMRIKNNNQRKEIDRICNERQPLIHKLSQAARVKTIQEMLRKDPLYVDLHGYREEQVDDMLQAIARMINEQVSIHSANEKIRVRTVRGKKTACLVLMTGKGIHSQGSRSVLKPAIEKWCIGNGVEFDLQTDHVKVYMLIK